MKKPVIGKNVFLADGCICIGDVTVGDDSSIWFHATVRGDRDRITIGRGSNVQDNCVVHTDEGYEVTIGDDVTIGHGAIIHGCTIGNNTLIGMGATVLNGAKIGNNCVIGAGAVVTQNTIVPDGTMMLGMPAKPIRQVTDEMIADNLANAKSYVEEAHMYLGMK